MELLKKVRLRSQKNHHHKPKDSGFVIQKPGFTIQKRCFVMVGFQKHFFRFIFEVLFMLKKMKSIHKSN